MKSSRPTLFARTALTVFLCAVPALAQRPANPGIFKDYKGPLSSRLRFLASDAGKQMLLHSPSPMALPLLQKFHPDAVGQYPQEPMMQPTPIGGRRFITGAQPNATLPLAANNCDNHTGTIMNLEPATNAVTQGEPSVDFLLNELGTNNDLVVETGNDNRGEFGTLDSLTGVYVHRDSSHPCFGATGSTDFEMGNPLIPDPLYTGGEMYSSGLGRVLADANPAHKQFFLMDTRYDGTTSGIGLRRVPTANFESTTTCPAGTLTGSQEATCIGTNGPAVIVAATLDDEQDSPSIAQDNRTSGTGAGDVYVVNTSLRVLRSVILLSACKETFATSSDCSSPVIVNALGEEEPTFASVAVVQGGPNAGTIVVTYVSPDSDTIRFATCTPHGAPSSPTCNTPSTVATDTNHIYSLTNNPRAPETWPVVAARTDSSGQTIFVVWSTCDTSGSYYLSGCPQADVTMRYATNLSSPTWTAVTVVNTIGHHVEPAIAYDTGQNIINISYYSTSAAFQKNQVVMVVKQIPSGSTTPGSSIFVTSLYDSTTGDGASSSDNPAYGEFMGLAAHGGSASGSSNAYIGFVNNNRDGVYSGIQNTQADNRVSDQRY